MHLIFIILHHLSADKRGQHFTNGHFNQHVSYFGQNKTERGEGPKRVSKNEVVTVHAERKAKAWDHALHVAADLQEDNMLPSRHTITSNI